MRALLLSFISLAFIGRSPAAEPPMLVLNTGGHTGTVYGVHFVKAEAKEDLNLFSKTTFALLSVAGDATVRSWNLTTGEATRVLRLPTGSGFSSALSPDEKFLAVQLRGANDTDHWVGLINVANGQIIRTFKGHTDVVQSLDFTRDGKWLASGSRDTVAKIWDVSSGECLHTLTGHRLLIRGVAFSPDGKKLATASGDGTGKIWDAAKGTELALLHDKDDEYASTSTIGWTPDGAQLVTGHFGLKNKVWSADGQLIRRGGDGGSTQVKVLPDGKAALTGSNGGKIHELETGQQVRHFRAHTGSCYSTALSADGKRAATGGVAGELYVWSVVDDAPAIRLMGKGFASHGIAWDADGRRIAWGAENTVRRHFSKPDTFYDDNPLDRAFDFETLELLPVPIKLAPRAEPTAGGATFDLATSTGIATLKIGDTAVKEVPGQFTSFASFKSSGLTGKPEVVVATTKGLFWLDVASGDEIRKYSQPFVVNEAAFSPDGKRLVTSSNNQIQQVWTRDAEAPLLSLFVAGNEWICWTAEGYYAASPGGEQLIGWVTKNAPDEMLNFYPAAQFRASLYRPDVIKLLLKEGSVEKALAVANAALPKPKAVVASVAYVLPPVVLITSPDSAKFESKDATLDLKFVAKAVGKQPITAVRLLIDGRPYPGTEHAKTFDPPRTNDVRETWTVKLSPGTHTYAVVAETVASKGVSEGVEVAFGARGLLRDPEDAKRAEELQKPAMYVLAIGVSAYADEKLKLNFAAKDAEAIAKAVEAGGKGIYRKVEAKVLTDKDATRKNILQGLTWMRKQMTQNDVGVISFAGHGEKDADGTFYLLPVDVDMTDLLSSAVPGDQIKKTLAGMPGKFVVLLDACHSGGIDGEKRRAAGSLTDDLVRDLATDEYGVVVLCSSTGREFSLESAKVGHGYFTLALIEGLNGKGPKTADGAVYLHHLDSYVTDRVKELSEGRQHPVTSKPSSLRSFPLAKP